MWIGNLSFVCNAIDLCFALVELIASALPIHDELVVAVGVHRRSILLLP